MTEITRITAIFIVETTGLEIIILIVTIRTITILATDIFIRDITVTVNTIGDPIRRTGMDTKKVVNTHGGVAMKKVCLALLFALSLVSLGGCVVYEGGPYSYYGPPRGYYYRPYGYYPRFYGFYIP